MQIKERLCKLKNFFTISVSDLLVSYNANKFGLSAFSTTQDDEDL